MTKLNYEPFTVTSVFPTEPDLEVFKVERADGADRAFVRVVVPNAQTGFYHVDCTMCGAASWCRHVREWDEQRRARQGPKPGKETGKRR